MPERPFDYDVAILGGGPGGYEAAIRCAQYGLKTALIEARELGGTCLNRGCIPTKALLHAAEVYEEIREAAVFGIQAGKPEIDFSKTTQFRDRQVAKLRAGIEALEKAHGVTVVRGFGRLTDRHTVVIDGAVITAENIILATGSAPARPPIPGMDGKNVLTSDEILSMNTLPDSAVIIGGGVIGIEFATLFAALERPVTVLEMLPGILPGIDTEITALLRRKLGKKGVSIINNAKVHGIAGGDTVTVDYELDGKTSRVEGGCCIVSVGRRPQTQDIGLDAVGIETQRGYIPVDGYMRTSVPNIYAIGDITGKIQLAHVASAQGLVASANCAGRPEMMDYSVVPSCIYTSPEIAAVGNLGPFEGRSVKTGVFHVSANGRSMVMNTTEGLVKITSDEATGEILGAQIMAPRATDMIAEIAAVMKCEGTIEELASTIHPHPTVSEIIMEAAHDTEGLCCHTLPKKKG